MADTQITAYEFQKLKLKAMLADVFIEEENIKIRMEQLTENKKQIQQKIIELDNYVKLHPQEVEKPEAKEDNDTLLVDDELLDEQTGEVREPESKKSGRKK